MILLLLIPVLVGTANLDTDTSAVPMEMFVSLIGIIMLTPVFRPEQDTDIDDLISSKYVSPVKIYVLRIVCSIVIIILLIGAFGAYLRFQNCDVTWKLLVGTAADALFLGSLGMVSASVSDSTVMAYMLPAVYYAANCSAGGSLSKYYLFSMTTGDFTPKLWMLATSVILTAASIVLKYMQRKCR